MSDVTGFFIEGGLFLTCPHCKHSNRVNVQSIFIPQHRGNPIECAKCKKEFHIKIDLVPVVEAVEQSVQPTASLTDVPFQDANAANYRFVKTKSG